MVGKNIGRVGKEKGARLLPSGWVGIEEDARLLPSGWVGIEEDARLLSSGWAGQEKSTRRLSSGPACRDVRGAGRSVGNIELGSFVVFDSRPSLPICTLSPSTRPTRKRGVILTHVLNHSRRNLSCRRPLRGVLDRLVASVRIGIIPMSGIFR